MGKEAKILMAVAAVVAVAVSALLIVSAQNKAEPSKSGSDFVREDSYQTAKGAKVTAVEFGDYQCPACALAEPTWEQLMQEYKDRVNFVFRNFPLPQHNNAEISAEAAEAAGEQGKFWEMHNKIYAAQKEWETSTNSLSLFISYAQAIGLDVNKFKADVEAKKFSAKIQRDIADGNTVGVTGTPTFYVNGEKVPNYENLKAAIDKALAQ